MSFHLRVLKPDLSRLVGPTTPAPPARAPSRRDFWRGAIIGFMAAFIVFDWTLLGGQTTQWVVYKVRLALWTATHGPRA
jgi:hypothetical protein